MSVIDRRIAALAGRQHGVVAARQLFEVGISRTAINRRAADGLLRRIHRGVYAFGSLTTPRSRWMAAVLALGPGALLSHREAAALHGLLSSGRSRTDVTVPGRARRREGIDVHATLALHAHDRASIDGIPVTSVARTLLDLAELVPPTQLKRAYEQAERLRVLDVRSIRELLERSNGRRGTRALGDLLEYDPSAAVETRSELERRFLELIGEANLPLPQINVIVEGFVVDAYWPSARLVVELQGYAWHSDPETFERDHDRIPRLKLAGYEVLAFTWRQVTRKPAWVVAAVSALLLEAASTPIHAASAGGAG